MSFWLAVQSLSRRHQPKSRKACGWILHCVSALRSPDEHIDLLADKSRKLAWVKCIDYLENPGIDTLGGIVGQRSFRQYIGFEAYEGERSCYPRITAQTGDCWAIWTDTPSLR